MTTPGLGGGISVAIVFDETIRERKKDGPPVVKAIADASQMPWALVFSVSRASQQPALDVSMEST